MKADTPLRAIRLKCLNCCMGSFAEVRLCTIPDCSLYPYRLGHNPKRKRINTTSIVYPILSLESEKPLLEGIIQSQTERKGKVK